MIKKFGNLLFILLFVFAITSCKDDNEDDVSDINPGTFEVTITGDTEGKFGGMAVFSKDIDEETGIEIFALILAPTSQQGITIVFAKTGDRPGKGTYPIKLIDIDWEDEGGDEDELDFLSPDFVAWAFSETGDIAGDWYFSKSGSITIKNSSAEALSGGFDFTALGLRVSEDYTSVEDIEAQFKGSFNAIYVNPDQVPDLGARPFQFNMN